MRLMHFLYAASAAAFLQAPALAHYHMLLPGAPSGERNKPVSITFQLGHPYEHQLFDASRPESVAAFTPDGKEIDLIKGLSKIEVAGTDGKKVAAYNINFTPSQRGDYTLVANTEAIWMDEEKEFWQDMVKVVYHVQTQKGWDTPTGWALQFVPLTRPYGLNAGMVFQAQVLERDKGKPGMMVEVEPYHPVPPKMLPADEEMTRRVKTDPNGIVTTTLNKSGWWCLTTQQEGGVRERKGDKFPVKKRATFWVYVN